MIIGYPHTSNWDFPLAMLWRFATGFPMLWVAKKEMFQNPLGGVFQRWGGIPLDRSRPEGFIEQVCAEFDKRDVFHLAIAPKEHANGPTTGRPAFIASRWRRNVPLGLGFLDYGKTKLGIADWIVLSGDRDADLERIRAFYADKRGYRSERAGEIRFRD